MVNMEKSETSFSRNMIDEAKDMISTRMGFKTVKYLDYRLFLADRRRKLLLCGGTCVEEGKGRERSRKIGHYQSRHASCSHLCHELL